MSDKPCEKCGHCPTCGRSNTPTLPYYPYPYTYPVYPQPNYYRYPYSYPYTVTCGTSTGSI